MGGTNTREEWSWGQCATFPEARFLVHLVELIKEKLLALSSHPFHTGSQLKNQSRLTSTAKNRCIHLYILWCIIYLYCKGYGHPPLLLLMYNLSILQGIWASTSTSSDRTFIYCKGYVHSPLHSLIEHLSAARDTCIHPYILLYHFDPSAPKSNFISFLKSDKWATHILLIPLFCDLWQMFIIHLNFTLPRRKSCHLPLEVFNRHILQVV